MREPQELRGDLAAIAGVDPSQVRMRTLILDLDLDSLALAEMVVMLNEKYRLTASFNEMLIRDWSGITIGALYEEHCQATARPT